jgi:hypothetical protein
MLPYVCLVTLQFSDYWLMIAKNLHDNLKETTSQLNFNADNLQIKESSHKRQTFIQAWKVPLKICTW